MNPIEVMLLLVFLIVALLIYLVASHKISVAELKAKFQGVTDQLHQVHGAAIAAATAAAPPPAAVAPIPSELVTAPVPVTAEEIRAIVAAAIPAPPAVTAAPPPPAVPVAVTLVDVTGPTLAQLLVGYPFEAGTTRFPMSVSAGATYTVEAIPTTDGYGSGNVAVKRPDGSDACPTQAIINGFCSAFPIAAAADEVVTVAVTCTRGGQIRRIT